MVIGALLVVRLTSFCSMQNLRTELGFAEDCLFVAVIDLSLPGTVTQVLV